MSLTIKEKKNKMDDTSSERREYFRVKDKAIINIKKIAPDQTLDTLMAQNSSFLLSSAINALELDHQTTLSKLKRSDPTIALYFDNINKKINLIADHIIDSDTDIQNTSGSSISLSASGIAINTDKDFNQDDLILIKLLLLPEKKGILSIGCIKRIKEENSTRTLYIDFTEISESDRELIIKHTITRQLEEVRDKKESLNK